MRYLFPVAAISFLVLVLAVPPAQAAWDFSKHSIPIEDITGGGPPKDGIPALFNPEYIPAEEADRLLNAEERVLGLKINSVTRAYPIRILSWHELVNDEISGTPYLVSW